MSSKWPKGMVIEGLKIYLADIAIHIVTHMDDDEGRSCKLQAITHCAGLSAVRHLSFCMTMTC